MLAWLVVNGFLENEKFRLVREWFARAAQKRRVHLLTKTNAEFMIPLGKPMLAGEGSERPKFVIFWDKDVTLARRLEDAGLRLFNSSSAIEACDDKSLTHMALERAGLPMPKTIIAPLTYAGVGYTDASFLDALEDGFGYPVIVKECFGSFGEQVYKLENKGELLEKLALLAGKPLLFQEYVKTSFARDVRLQVVGGEVVASMYRYCETGDFRANISNGGRMKAYEPSREESDLAIRACKAVGVDFAGVDVLFGEDGPLVCEVNSNAHFIHLFNCTGVDVAYSIVDYAARAMGNP